MWLLLIFESIVVVPGLGCNALGSWKASDLSDIWPRDFLPSDIPRARVLLFGYNTKLLDSHSNRSIRDLGSHLFETLTRLREEEEVRSTILKYSTALNNSGED